MREMVCGRERKRGEGRRRGLSIHGGVTVGIALAVEEVTGD